MFSKTEKVELSIGILFAALILFSILTPYTFPIQTKYVPNALDGLTTVLGILLGFSGFLLEHTYNSNKTNKKFKDWFQWRLMLSFLIVSLGLTCVSISYTMLVGGQLIPSWRLAFIGFVLIEYLTIESFLITFTAP